MYARENPIGVLLRFSRLVSGTATPDEILPLLAEAAVEHLSASAAAVFSVSEKGDLELVTSRELPAGLVLRAAADSIGPELGEQLLMQCEHRFAEAYTMPLVSGGDLYGALVLLFYRPVVLGSPRRELADGLVDLAAIALSKASQYARLQRSYAELKASRQVLARSEKLRALGEMAAGVSHDLKNILSPILMQVQMLRRLGDTMAADELQDTLSRMEQVLWRGVDTVDRLRKFSRQTPDARVVRASVDDVVREALTLCRPRLRQPEGEIFLREELGAPPPVPLETTECMNAVMNLLVNAIEALPRGGRIWVRTGSHAGGAWIEVSDSGPGIPPEVEARLFEPFFTTKGEQGTGLGLPMVYAFVQRHGGTVKVATSKGQGTTFTLWLPGA